MEDTYRFLGSSPVSDTEPCGRDARYDDVFASLQQEMDKRSSPLSRDSFSWETVAKNASLILKDHSKDLLAASYLAAALTHIHGARGLLTGTTVLRDLLSLHWENMFPPKKRLKGRIAALSWWIEKTDAAIDEGRIQGMDHDNRGEIVGSLKTIDGLLQHHTPEEDLSLLPLIRKVAGHPVVDRPSPESEVRTASPLSPPQRTVAVEPFDASSLNLTEGDIHKNLGPLFQKIKQAAKIISDDRPGNPQGYRWLRYAIWEPLTGLPVSKDRITRVPPPSPQLVSHLETLEGDEDWQGLLQASESALHSSRNLFYLDLNRYSHTALSRLGEKFGPADRAVITETRHFVSRLKDVETLLFSDSTPFASARTRAWLKEPAPECDGQGVAHALKSRAHEAIQPVLDQLGKIGKIHDAAVFFQEKIKEIHKGKDVLILRLELIKLLSASKQGKMVSSQVEEVLDAIKKHKLDIWEPELAFNALKTIYTALKTCPDACLSVRPDEVLVLLGKINLSEAMNL